MLVGLAPVSEAAGERTISLLESGKTSFVRSKLVDEPWRERTHPCVGYAFVRSFATIRQGVQPQDQPGLCLPELCIPTCGVEVAPQAVEHCVERVSRLYERGVDPIHIGAYVRRWLRWARSGLRTLGVGLSERALELVRLAPGRLGLPAAVSAALRTSLANLGVGDAAHHPTDRQ